MKKNFRTRRIEAIAERVWWRLSISAFIGWLLAGFILRLVGFDL